MNSILQKLASLVGWFALLALAPLVHAEDIYVAQTTQGGGTGADAANAKDIAFFNTAGNWSSPANVAGKIGPGDTVHLVGTFTSAITIQASGTAGNVITVLFEPGAKFSAPAWPGPKQLPSAGAIIIDTKNYITIDGGSNGIIENTANGTGLGNQVDSVGVNGTSCSHFVVKNLTIRNLYIRTIGAEQNNYGSAVLNTAKNDAPWTDIRVTNCTISDCYVGVTLDYPLAGANTAEIDHNTIYNINWGAIWGDRVNGAIASGMLFHDNIVHDFANWDDTAASNSWHHNALFCWAVTANAGGGQSRISNIRAYNNIIGPNFGNRSTSGLFWQGGVDDIYVYNNIFLANANDAPTNGFIFINPYRDFDVAADAYVFNNTFIGGNKGIGVDGDSNHTVNGGALSGTLTLNVKNNIMSGLGAAVTIFGSATVTGVIDYNLGFNLVSGQGYSYSSNSSAVFKTFAQWQALGFDANGLNGTDPLLTGGNTLVLTSPAVDAGTDLSAFFTSDKAGASRPSGVAWDIGAYEFVQTNPVIVTQPPASPFVAFTATATLAVVARGQAPLTYQWKKGGTPLVNGGNVSGATSATLTLTNASAGDSATYTVEVNNALGPLVTSNNSVLTIGAGVAPSFTTQPAASQTVLIGATVNFTAAASGTPTPTFQWKKNGVNLTNGGIVSGATSTTLTLTGVTSADAGTYTVVADNSVPPAATSNNAVLSVTGVAPSISTPPASQTALVGASVTFNVTASGTAPLTYQWQRNAVDISGATASSYTIAAAQTGDAGSYTVTVTNSISSVTSAAATLVVNTPVLIPLPTISSQPSAATVVSGHNVSFSVAASGSTSYVWQVSGDGGATWTSLANDATYSGATTNTLTVSNASGTLDGFKFRAIALNDGGTITSNAATLAVLPPVFISPYDVAVAADGRMLVTDNSTNVVQNVSTARLATVLAGFANLPGSTDGSLGLGLFRQPAGVALDQTGNLYVADSGNSLIRKVSPGGALTTVAGSWFNQAYRDGVGTAAWFNLPLGIAVDAAGNLFVADTGNSVIRKITPAGTVTTLAGVAGDRGSADGTGAAARFNQPTGIAVDGTGNLYVADTFNQTIRRITSAGAVTTLAGVPGVAGADDGTGTNALFNQPAGVTVDGSGTLYVSDSGNSTIRRISAAGNVTTFAGLPTISGLVDGTGLNALFNHPLGLRLDSAGNLYVVDNGNAVIRRVTAAGAVTTLIISQGIIESTPVTTITPTPPTAPTAPIPPTLPAPSSSGGGGGGAPSTWFLLALLAVSALRYRQSHCRQPG